jgi:uncharacterized protein (DUF952 family)
MIIIHILPRTEWERAQAAGTYRAASLNSEGFIHFSTPEQIPHTANDYYHGQSGLVMLVCDTDKLSAELKWEGARNGWLFPHLYGELNLDAVIRVLDLPMQPDGSFQIDPQQLMLH